MAIRLSTLLREERSSCLLSSFSTFPALLEEASQQQQVPPALCISISADDSLLRRPCESGQSHNDLHALSRPLSLPTYLLKASIGSNCAPLALCTFAHITLHDIPLHGYLGDYLVMALAKCGAVDDARHVSSGLPGLSVFSWTSIISAYADSGRGLEALEAWQQMQNDRVDPDSFTFLSLFKACIAIPDLEKGRSLHAIAQKKGFTSNVFVGNAIVNMYGICGLLSEAENAFAELCYRTTASWNLLLAATVEQGQWQKALDLHSQMEHDGAEPDSFTFVSLFKACSSIPDLPHGRELHAYAKRKGLESNSYVGNTILNMYRKCGALISEAEAAFSALSTRNLVSWTGMVSAYVDHDDGEKALRLYRQMQNEGVFPDQATLGQVLQACIILAEHLDDHGASNGLREGCLLEIGQALHAHASRDKMHLDTMTATGFVTMYGKFGRLSNAEHVFSTLEQLDIVAWNAMLSAYVENRQGEKALLLYTHMQKQGFLPKDITFMTILQACGLLGENRESYISGRPYAIIGLEIAQLVHMDICTRGIGTNLPISNTLVSVYGKCGALVEAESVFNATPECDIVSWNAMLTACMLSGQGEKVLHLYEKILETHVTHDEVTCIGIIQACGETGSLETCKKVHFVALFSEYDRILAIAVTLMDAYRNLASSADAQVVFDYILHPNVVSWNACIASDQEGDFNASLRLLDLMNHSIVIPNIVTLTSILSVCSHSGLVAEGFRYIESMRIAHDIPLDRTHFKLMIDLLGRAEDFNRMSFLLEMLPAPMLADPVIWQCVLDASTTAGHFELGKQALDYVLSLHACQS